MRGSDVTGDVVDVDVELDGVDVDIDTVMVVVVDVVARRWVGRQTQ